MSPINYFNQLKIQKACQLLDFTDKKAKEIAFELAFNDPYYFSKVFTKYMHMSPKEYRMKRLSQNETAFFVFAKKIGQVLTSLSQNLPVSLIFCILGNQVKISQR